MAVRYKKNGRYAYETHSVWNKEKKKYETKWTYLGIADKAGEYERRSGQAAERHEEISPADYTDNYVLADEVDAYDYFTMTPELEIPRLIGITDAKSPKEIDFFVGNHFHTYWVLYYVNQGVLKVETGNSEYMLKAGEMIIRRPTEQYEFRVYENNKVNFYNIGFVCTNPIMQSLEHWIIYLSSKERGYLDNVMHLYSDFLFEKFAAATQNPHIRTPFGVVQELRANLEQLMISVINRDKSVSIREREESYLKKESARQLVRLITAYMRKNISQTLTLSRISKDLGYSVSHIKEIFKKEKNQGVIDYFINLKITAAKHMIQEGELNCKEISEKLGFYSPSYFTSAFKKREGIPPSKYGR